MVLEHGAVRLENQAPHSVRVIKLIDSTVPAAAPAITAKVPTEAAVSEPIQVSAGVDAGGVPALGYHWDFGDGTSADGPRATHAYTRSAGFTIRLTVDGLDGVAARQSFPVQVSGMLDRPSDLTRNRRYAEPGER